MRDPMDLVLLARERYNEDYILHERNRRVEHFQEWKTRIQDLKALARGDFNIVFPDESAIQDKSSVQNIIESGLNDTADLVAETTPAVRCEPMGTSDDHYRKAQFREAIAHTYWEVNNAESWIPQLSMDLDGTGFVGVCVLPGDVYPKLYRIDPDHAYPDINNGELHDLMCLSRMKVRHLIHMFPDVDIPLIRQDDTCEVIDYYGPDLVAKVAMLGGGNVRSDGPVVPILWYRNDLGRPPVAFETLNSLDSAFRGNYDQVAGPLVTMNRIFRLMLDQADSGVYAPAIEFDVENPEDPPGPQTIYHARSAEAYIRRMEPNSMNPQLYALLDLLETQIRGGAAYPASRQGNIDQAIASAKFVDATMGQLTTKVRKIQRKLGSVRRQINEIAFHVDERYLNFEKGLWAPVGTKKVYLPGKDIAGIHQNRVVYGAGAGLDFVNRKVAMHQDVAMGLVSKQTAREQTDYITDPGAEEQKLEREMVNNALAQSFISMATQDPMAMARIAALVQDGKTIMEANAVVVREAQELAAAEPEMPAPDEAALAQQSLEAGGIPGQAPAAPEVDPFLNQPLPNVFVSNR